MTFKKFAIFRQNLSERWSRTKTLLKILIQNIMVRTLPIFKVIFTKNTVASTKNINTCIENLLCQCRWSFPYFWTLFHFSKEIFQKSEAIDF